MRAFQPLFLCAAKKKPLAVKRKRQRGLCVGTNSTSLILPATSGGQASSVPLLLLFPHESLRWIRVGALPLCNPLKRPRRGLWPPSLDHPRGLVCAETDSDLQNALQMRIWQTGMVVEIRYVCFGRDLNGSSFVRDMHGRACCAAALRLPYVKYSTGANETTRTAYRALRKPDWAAARRAF